MVRMRLCSIIGSIMRHATTVDSEIYSLNLAEVLGEVVVKDKQEKVKRKAMGALGEYLFYAATQLEEVTNNNNNDNTSCLNLQKQWGMSHQSFLVLSRVLKNMNEDEITKLYAIKTIENITAQSQVASQQFINNDFVNILVTIFNQCKNELIKTSAVIILCNIVRLNDEYSLKILESIGQKNIYSYLKNDD